MRPKRRQSFLFENTAVLSVVSLEVICCVFFFTDLHITTKCTAFIAATVMSEE
jgi:hypothetical protein